MSKLIIPLIFFFAGLAVLAMFIVPGWQHFLSVKADSRRLQDINAEVDTLTQKRDELVDQINSITRDSLTRLDQMVPLAAHAPEFLVAVQKMATTHLLRITRLDLAADISTKPKIPPPNLESVESQQGTAAGYQTMRVNMEVTGPYESFKNFLQELESSIRITDVSALTLKPVENGFSMLLSLDAYYQ